MKITDLSRSNRCFIRGVTIADTPEERVRQTLLRKMVGALGFPKGLISVERGTRNRRTDIVCYTQQARALLLVECKAGPLGGALSQAIGYNETLKAPFICLANEVEEITCWFEKGKEVSVPFLPHFQELYGAARL